MFDEDHSYQNDWKLSDIKIISVSDEHTLDADALYKREEDRKQFEIQKKKEEKETQEYQRFKKRFS